MLGALGESFVVRFPRKTHLKNSLIWASVTVFGEPVPFVSCSFSQCGGGSITFRLDRFIESTDGLGLFLVRHDLDALGDSVSFGR